MNLKKVIQYIAEEDLEINLTLQVGSESSEGLKEEIRKLRQELGNLSLPEPDVEDDEMSLEEAQEEYENLEIGPDPDAEDDDAVDMSELEDIEEETSEENTEAEVEDQPADPEQAEEEFEEMFGEEEPEEAEEEPDPEPSEEERDEAEADFEELFGGAV